MKSRIFGALALAMMGMVGVSGAMAETTVIVPQGKAPNILLFSSAEVISDVLIELFSPSQGKWEPFISGSPGRGFPRDVSPPEEAWKNACPQACIIRISAKIQVDGHDQPFTRAQKNGTMITFFDSNDNPHTRVQITPR